MSENSLNDNTLLRNNISLFILRVDIFPTIDFDLFSVINKITNNFDRVEKRIVTNFSVILKEGNPEINKTENFDYVLINDNPRNSLTFSKITNSFWFETNQYKNNKTYHDIFSLIIQALSSISIGIESKRIGMRYINDFPCSNKKNISKIFNPTISKTIANLVSKTDISRAIAQEEYNYSTSKLRVQYGIPNKFFPSVINNYDLLLDLDSYDDTHHKTNDWQSCLVELNHKAYEKFIETINPKYLEELK